MPDIHFNSEKNQLMDRLSDQIYKILRSSIISWEIKPGERLLQEKLASEFGVSQMTIREALGRLTAEGLTIHEPYRGTRVVSISVDELEDIFDVRLILESKAMELAAKEITPSDIQKMKELLPYTVADPNSFLESVDEARSANHDFHWIAINSSKRRYLCQHLKMIWAKIDPYLIYNPWLYRIYSKEELLEDINIDIRTHSLLIKTFEMRDADKARKLTEDAINTSLSIYQRLLSLADEKTLFPRNEG